MLVFDSSALFAYLQSENGADMVSELLDDADVPKYAQQRRQKRKSAGIH